MQNTTMQGSTPGALGSTQGVADLTGGASSKLDQLSEVAQQTVNRLTETASRAASRLSARGEELWELQGRAAETARTYMREHPLATIGIAVGIGIVLSRLLSRR